MARSGESSAVSRCPKALGRGRLDALRSLRRRGEEIALTRQRVPLGRLRLGAGHLGQLPLRILSGRVRLLGGSHIVDVAQERGEIEFGIERLQLVDVGRADRQIVGRELHGHVGADGGQILRQQQAVAPRGDLLALLTLYLVDVGEDVLHRAPLGHQLARPLLAYARDARDVVRRVAPQRQNVAHQNGIVDAVLGAYGRGVDDLDAVALLFVDVAARTHQLAVILVGGDHIYVVTRLRGAVGERADHVVGLVTLDFEHGDAHGFEQTA